MRNGPVAIAPDTPIAMAAATGQPNALQSWQNVANNMIQLTCLIGGRIQLGGHGRKFSFGCK